MMFESYGYTMDDVYFAWLDDPVEVDPANQLLQFTLTEKILFDCSQNYTAGAFTCLSVKFRMKRDVGYHVIRSFLPSALLVVVSWAAFWLGRDAPAARVLVVLLSMTSFVFLANSSYNEALPPVSYITAMEVWFAACFLFVFAALLEIAGVEFFLKYRPQVERGVNEKGEIHITPGVEAA